MSKQNLELSRRLADAWDRRDAEAAVGLWDPAGVWYPPFEGTMEGRVYRGRDEVRQYFEDLAEFSEESHAEYPDVRDLGDKVLCLGRVHFRFASGLELDHEAALFLGWRNGRCVEARAWLSHAEGLEAAGLSE